MKKIIKTVIVCVLMVAMVLPLCSCDKKVESFRDVLEMFGIGNNNEGKNRTQRIEGSMAKAKDAQKAYNMSRSLASMEAQPAGTIYIVENNGFYVEFTVEEGSLNLVDTNPEEIPEEDPYKGNKDYHKEKDSALLENVPTDVIIYLPKGQN